MLIKVILTLESVKKCKKNLASQMGILLINVYCYCNVYKHKFAVSYLLLRCGNAPGES